MRKDQAPRWEIPCQLTEKEYVKATLLLSRRTGTLKNLPGAIVGAILLLTVGTLSFRWASVHPVVGVGLCLGCPLLLFLYFVMEPAGIRRQAKTEYARVQALMEPAVFRFFADEVVTQTPTLTLTDPYARMVECVETPELFLLIKDRDRAMILPKRCLPPAQEKDASAFLRQTFMRKRRLMRNWIF